tara:strand:+ start:3316 stop:3897 length:582 start_codon:yes stop_codon:yes gene_type:complete
MSCNCCNCSLINGFYKCDINDYRIVDENDNLVKVILDHEINEEEEEVNTKEKIKYCKTCNKVFRYPDTEENYIFKCGDNQFESFDNSDNDNIIYQFTDITCKYCNTNILQKGYFTNTEMIQSEENLLQYSYPNNFTNTIHIYNENTNNKIKDITIGLTEINPIPETDIGKKIIYCPDCNFFIMNNLQEVYLSE